MKINKRKIPTFANSGIDFIRAETRVLRLGKAFILFKGLSTLRVLKAFKLTDFKVISIIPVITTKKSITFHPSRR